MVKQHIKKITFWIEKNGFPLLLLSTFLVLTLTPFTGDGVLPDIMLMITMSFLFIQSMSAENVNKSQKRILRIVVFILIVVTWFRPMGIETIFS